MTKVVWVLLRCDYDARWIESIWYDENAARKEEMFLRDLDKGHNLGDYDYDVQCWEVQS